MYQNCKEYDIRYTDVDYYDHMKLSAILGILQESASISADELGFGYDDRIVKGFAFIVSNWYIELFRPINVGEKVKCITWPIKPKHVLFFRDFELYVGEEKVGVATSRWCLMDLAKYSVLPVKAFFENDTREYNDCRSVEYSSWKIPAICQDAPVYSKTISYTDYDHYNHVNNTKYADFVFDAFSIDEMKNKYISSVQVTYVNQCKCGEKIDISKTYLDGYCYLEGKVNGELRVQFKVKFNEL
ncbi:MAG: hypothetical protein J6B04_00660 [Clostridia bacterium]|nr:hypothetical protein [Clostridia bacterium]